MKNVKNLLLSAFATCAALGFTACQNLDNPNEGDKATISAGDAEFEMIYVAPGDFRMGATAEQKQTMPNETPAHDVKLTKGFWIGRVEVTQEQWAAIMGSDPSSLKDDSRKDLPVNNVTWAECQAFVKKVSELSGHKFRLPTEAEWEFAARGGHKADGLLYSGSIYVENVACYKSNSNGTLSQVGAYMPNKLDIRDMSGNVAEWVADNYALFKDSVYTDPLISLGDTVAHVARGGNFSSGQSGVRTSSRESYDPDFKSAIIGLRLVME